MHESTLSDLTPKRRPHRLRAVLIGLVVSGLVGLAVVWGVRSRFLQEAEKRLQATEAEADRLDPGWRWQELLAKQEVIPDEENAAACVVAAVALLPQQSWMPRRSPAAGEKPADPAEPNDTEEPPFLSDAIGKLSPAKRPDAALTADLRAALKEVQPALTKAHELARLSRGRFPINWAPNPGQTPLDNLQQTRSVAALLSLDAALAAEEGDRERGLTACRAILNIARSIGEELNPICFLVRIACTHVAMRSLERLLAQGELADKDLAVLQELLEDEARQPILRAALRGERGSQWNFWEQVYLGAINADGSPASSGALETYQWLFLRPQLRHLQADLVEALTEAVEITKQDPATQWPAWKAWSDEHQQMRERSMGQVMVSLLASSIQRVGQANYRNQAVLHSARVALAAERHRLANGKWPETMEQLAPRFLTKIPLDPFAQERLRMRRTEEGLVIYSVGPNEQDDGGDVNATSNQELRDIGFRLWDLDRRRQPPAK